MASYLRTEIRRNATTAVTVMPSGRTVELASGARLIDALLLAGQVLTEHCGGRARCGVCHVRVLEGARGLSKVRRDERQRLTQIGGMEATSRLSCQAILGIHKVMIELVN